MNLLTLKYYKIYEFLDNIKSENLGFYFSFILHLFILLFAIGLPNFFDSKPIMIPTIIPIEIINVSEITSMPKEVKKLKSAEPNQSKIKEKKFNSSTNQEIKKIDIKDDGCFSYSIDLFKSGAGKLESERLGVPLLGQIPISPDIVETTDNGMPIVEKDQESYLSKIYLGIANNIFDKIKST